MKRLMILIFMISLGFLVAGCDMIDVHMPYSFLHPIEEISSIEIAEVLSETHDEEHETIPGTKTITVSYTEGWEEHYVDIVTKTVAIISEDRYAELIENVSAIEGSYLFNLSESETGKNVLFITYENGDIEVIGHSTYWYTSNGEFLSNCYVFESEQFYALLSSYIDAAE